MEKIEQKKEDLKIRLDNQMGNVTAACKKMDISRDTFYRWKAEDEEWGKEIDDLVGRKRYEMNDFAEGKLYENINNGNITCLIFYLKTKHPDYKQKIDLSGEVTQNVKLSDDEKELLKQAIRFAYPGGEDTE